MSKASTIVLVFLVTLRVFGQGTFVNLTFEEANIPPGTQIAQYIPIADGLPGWSASMEGPTSTNPVTEVVYDGVSLGGPFVSINDAASGLAPMQGRYSAWLFGSGLQGFGTATTISQTGLVPVGTMSLSMDIDAVSFIVAMDGQALTMIPVLNFPTYTVYEANISPYAGEIAQLSITAPPTGQPNGVGVDNILFSTNPIPEPGTLALGAAGALLLGLTRLLKTPPRR